MKYAKEVFILSIIGIFIIGTIVSRRLSKDREAITGLYAHKLELQRQIDSLEVNQDSLREITDSLKLKLAYWEPPEQTRAPIFTDITVTMYNATEQQCDQDPLITASGDVIVPYLASGYRWIAVSRDLLYYNGGPFRYNDLVYLARAGRKSGYYKVKDTMAPRWTRRIDILETTGIPQYKFNKVHLYKI